MHSLECFKVTLQSILLFSLLGLPVGPYAVSCRTLVDLLLRRIRNVCPCMSIPTSLNVDDALAIHGREWLCGGMAWVSGYRFH